MAKKTTRSGRPQAGGRVTPKGVQPAGAARKEGGGRAPAPTPVVARRLDPGRSRIRGSQHAPIRSGHHRGQR